MSLNRNLFFLGSGLWEFRLEMLEKSIHILKSLGIVPHLQIHVAFGILWLMEIITLRSYLCVCVQLCLALRDTSCTGCSLAKMTSFLLDYIYKDLISK